MATLFIGPPEKVFRWEDHLQFCIGVGIGFLVASALLFAYFVTLGDKNYEAIAMNDLKSKALD